MFLKGGERIKINFDNAYKYFDRATLFFLCVLIFFIPISNAAIQISVSLAILSFIGATISKRFKNICSTALNIPLLVFFIFLCLSVIFASNPQKSLITLLKKNLEWFLIFLTVVSTLNSKKRIGIFLEVLLFSAIVVCFDGIYQQILGVDLIREYAYNYKMSASFSHYNNFAAYLEVLLPISIILFIVSKRKFSKKVFAFFSLFLGYCLILTLSKGGYLAFLVVYIFLIFFILFKLKIKDRKKTVIESIIFLSILILIIFVVIKALPSGEIRARFFFEWWYGGRNAIWHRTCILIGSKPLIGYGPGSFIQVFSKINTHYKPLYAHNCYLQMLVEIGALGLFSFLLITAAFLKISIKSVIKNNDFLLLGVICGLIAFLLHAGIDTHFYSMQLSDFFWIMLGLAMAMAKHGPVEI